MERYGFFNGQNNNYGQEELSRMFSELFENGVKANKDGSMTFKVTKSGESILVEKGFALIEGYWLDNTDRKIFNIIKDSTYSRRDRIIIKLDMSNLRLSIQHKLGVAGTNPQAPELQRDNIVHEISLAQFEVKQSGEIIISDERYKNELCGAIRPKNLTEFNTMIDGMMETFNIWMSSQTSKGWRNQYIQDSIPENPEVGSIWLQKNAI